MNKQEAFEKGIKNAKSVGQKGALKKEKAVDFNAWFQARGIDVNAGLDK